jgi:hypothetical protein
VDQNSSFVRPASPHGPRASIRHGLRRASVFVSLVASILLVPLGGLAFAALGQVWRDPRTRMRRMQRMTVAAYRSLHDWMRIVDLVDFDHRGGLVGMPPGPCVVVANHVRRFFEAREHALVHELHREREVRVANTTL